MISLEHLESILQHSWKMDTCYPPLRGKWNKENPYIGQCAVTSLIVQDIFGGKIVVCEEMHHYWNQLPSGMHADFTKDQFPSYTFLDNYKVSSRDHILDIKHEKASETNWRYQLLKNRVSKQIRNPMLVTESLETISY